MASSDAARNNTQDLLSSRVGRDAGQGTMEYLCTSNAMYPNGHPRTACSVGGFAPNMSRTGSDNYHAGALHLVNILLPVLPAAFST